MNKFNTLLLITIAVLIWVTRPKDNSSELIEKYFRGKEFVNTLPSAIKAPGRIGGFLTETTAKKLGEKV